MVAALLATAEPYNTGGAPLAERAQRGACFAVVAPAASRNDAPAIVAAYSLELGADGVVWIAAAAGRGPVNLTLNVLPAIEAQAREAGAVGLGFATVRPGLVRRAERAGYTVAAVRKGGAYHLLKKLA